MTEKEIYRLALEDAESESIENLETAEKIYDKIIET